MFRLGFLNLFYIFTLLASLTGGGGVASLPLPLNLVIDGKSASYVIQVGNHTWLESASTRLGNLNSADKSLVKSDIETGEGKDKYGKFNYTTFGWASKDKDSSNDVIMYTSFKVYPHDTSMIIFEQYFPMTFDNNNSSKASSLAAVSLFPSFQRNSLACVSYDGVFPHMTYSHLSDYKESYMGGSPLVIYNESDPFLPALILSPLDWPMAHHMASSPTMVGAGIKSTVTEIPAGWRQQFLISSSYGINNAFLAWGGRMLKYNDVSHEIRSYNLYRDQTHSTIGFWTDNGGYYHYNTGVKNATYEQVLPQVKAYHDSIGVPFGHWQIDSWFYPKDGPTSSGGAGGAVVNWTAMPSVFPSGMESFQKQLGLPLVVHNRQFSTRSDYIKNWRDIDWFKGQNYAIPKDPEAFFRRFFTQQEGWGLTMYEQDWMCTQYQGTDALKSNISMGDLWLTGMAAGAASKNLTIQYCMPYPSQVLAAARMPSVVTTARASGDYGPNKNQWAIGPTSLFYWALGVLPLKDGFYSSTLKQVNGQTVGPELRPDLQALIATLSCSFVGPMDGIHLMNATRIMQTCRSDGLILKPDKPIATSDFCFYKGLPASSATDHDPSKCYVYLTHSDIPGLGRVSYCFSNQKESRELSPSMTHLEEEDVGKYAIYNWYTKELSLFGKNQKVSPGYEGHSYSVITPVLSGGWIFLGEIDKYVPASRQRFSKVWTTGDGKLLIKSSGAPGESIRICAALVSHLPHIHCDRVTYPSNALHSLSLETVSPWRDSGNTTAVAAWSIA